MIDENGHPWNILAITFTNKAAREMRERAEKLKTEAQDCLIATFHSMCVRILRREADHMATTATLLSLIQVSSGL
ncbi:UvrD-helicase domain-containing protein [Streptococcus sanguinis]|uniref:UvrD-helicase domain-containing protein n=1 Tax=Streptococcus sanguinis TaxID=1305 RepID=A0A7Y0VBH2_STRSA|nr:UvrD-helicase domain-containing protein [Streptococcus sanguinis]